MDTLASVLDTRVGVLDTRAWQFGELRRVQPRGCGWLLGHLGVLDTCVSVWDTRASVLDEPPYGQALLGGRCRPKTGQRK